MSFSTLKRELLAQGKMFVDTEFSPNMKALYFNGIPSPNKASNVVWKRPGGKMFVDTEFPPNVKSLYFNGVPPQNQFKNLNAVWKRPGNLVSRPKFIVGKATRFDLDQGQLGDCWYVAAAATLATSHQKQFACVCPQDQSFETDYAGIFRFNFWRYGQWTEVVVDDYLPCDQWGLIYCKNKGEPTEFWAALMEKAYAKLYGCYQALDGGKLNNALVDFTGGISEVLDIEDKSKLPHDLYETMVKTSKMNSMMGAAIYRPPNAESPEVERPNGLFMGHAYSVTGFVTMKYPGQSVKLLRLRNPWGKGEWNGPWSDRSPEMRNLAPEQKRLLHIVIANDGEFWISYEDFLANFDEIAFCHLQPDALTQEVALDTLKNQWTVTVYHDAWIRGVTAGGCGNPPNEKLYWSNPQFHVSLSENDDDTTPGCTLVVSLMEKEHDTRKQVAIGYDIYKGGYPEPLDGQKVNRRALRLATRAGNYKYDREVSRRFVMSPGIYVIVPSTFHAHKEAEFILRLFTEKNAPSGVIDVPTGPTEIVKPPVDLIEEMFNKYSGSDGKVDAQELSLIINEAFQKNGGKMNFNLETCRCIHVMMDTVEFEDPIIICSNVIENKALEKGQTDRSGFLNLHETRDMWKQTKAYKKIFHQFDRNKSGNVDSYELGAMFKTLGFPVGRQVLTSIVRRYGGRNNRISLEDFIMIVCKITTMYHIYADQRQKTGATNGSTSFTLEEWLQNTMFC